MDFVDNYKNMFQSRIAAGAVEKLPEAEAPGKSETNTISSWSYDMEGHAKKCVARYFELAIKTTEQLYEVATPCLDDHHFQENQSIGELSTVCPQIVLNCLYLARIGRPDILWSVKFLARAVTKWTKAGDKRLARLISSFVTHVNTGNIVMWETLPQQSRLGLFPDSDFAVDLEDSKSTSGGLLCIFGSQTFVPISWMCRKQTTVSHSSTDAEFIPGVA